MKKIEAVRKFLQSQPFARGQRYYGELEVQVNVARDNGEVVQGVYSGQRWEGFTDGLTTWKHFRIPWKSGTAPEYVDSDLKFNLPDHVEAIGMTGWNWVQARSEWVAFDFDSLVSHKTGLTEKELNDILKRLEELPWISIYTSTSGNGYHVYVDLLVDNVPTHTAHAAVARAILNKISALTGLDLQAKVDTLGGNIWVWHRKAVEGDSYVCIKEGALLTEAPTNWQQYITKPTTQKQSSLEQLSASQRHLPLDEEHLRLIRWFEEHTGRWWWDDLRHMLVCHTFDLQWAFNDLCLKGVFTTISTGKDQGTDYNCFVFPLPDGAWIVRRYSRGVPESPTWFIDSGGWTTCYLNRQPSFRIAAQMTGGVEGLKDYYFRTLEQARITLYYLGIDFQIPLGWGKRPTYIRHESTGKLLLTVDRIDCDEEPAGWVNKKKTWQRIFFIPKIVEDIDLPDNLIRHTVVGHVSYGWQLFTNEHWVEEDKQNLSNALLSSGKKRSEIELILGQAILNPWYVVCKPFLHEYPGNREWNRYAPQLRYIPDEGDHPFWDNIFSHVGHELTAVVKKDDWCKDNGIISGSLYLQCWLAALLQAPTEPLPYIFLYGPENSGKSILHEAITLLLTSGSVRADNALTNQAGFNGELATAILCIVEETNLSKKTTATDRIKDWVTGRKISIHCKGKQPVDTPNHTHWIQCANKPDYCQVFPGDTRIVVIHVDKIEKEIPKREMLTYLEKEGPAITFDLLQFTLPQTLGRLRIPAIETQSKRDLQDSNRSALDIFIEEKCYIISGSVLRFSDFFTAFMQWLPIGERDHWSARRVSRECPLAKGRWGGDGQIFIGNVSFSKDTVPTKRLERQDDRLGYV